MATLRKYTIVKTPKYSKLWTPERAILLAFCIAVGGSVFLTLQTSNLTGQPGSERFAGIGVSVPIASHLAAALDQAGKPKTLARAPAQPPARQVASARENQLRAQQAAISSQLAAERRLAAERLFAQRNVDRTPVASIPDNTASIVSSGFREIAPAPAGGFREIPRWKPSAD